MVRKYQKEITATCARARLVGRWFVRIKFVAAITMAKL